MAFVKLPNGWVYCHFLKIVSDKVRPIFNENCSVLIKCAKVIIYSVELFRRICSTVYLFDNNAGCFNIYSNQGKYTVLVWACLVLITAESCSWRSTGPAGIKPQSQVFP